MKCGFYYLKRLARATTYLFIMLLLYNILHRNPSSHKYTQYLKPIHTPVPGKGKTEILKVRIDLAVMYCTLSGSMGISITHETHQSKESMLLIMVFQLNLTG